MQVISEGDNQTVRTAFCQQGNAARGNPTAGRRGGYPPPGRQRGVLSCISHRVPAAAANLQRFAAFAPIGLLDVPSSTTARPSGRKHLISLQLSALATKPGEICRLEICPGSGGRLGIEAAPEREVQLDAIEALARGQLNDGGLGFQLLGLKG